jgi:hypothetical protein
MGWKVYYVTNETELLKFAFDFHNKTMSKYDVLVVNSFKKMSDIF